MLPIRLGLQVLVAAMSGDNYPNALPVDTDEELPLSALDSCNRFWLRDLPLLAIVIPTNVPDPFVRVVPVGLVDAFDLIRLRHLLLSNLGGIGNAELFC